MARTGTSPANAKAVVGVGEAEAVAVGVAAEVAEGASNAGNTATSAANAASNYPGCRSIPITASNRHNTQFNFFSVELYSCQFQWQVFLPTIHWFFSSKIPEVDGSEASKKID